MAMPRHTLDFVTSPKPSQVRVTELDPEMKTELENAWKHLQANPDQEIKAGFDSGAEAKRYLTHAKAWGRSRDGEQLEVRKLARKELPEHVLAFTIRKFDPDAKHPGRPASHASRAAEQAKHDSKKS